MDLFILKEIVSELQKILTGARVGKVMQPSPHDMVLTLKAPSAVHQLLISISPQFPRICLTEIPAANEQIPGTFCQFLRKHLLGAVIHSITQVEMERVVNINFGKRDPLGRLVNSSLIVEIMGKHSNIILTEYPEMLILESFKRVDFNLSRKREILPGLTYRLPPAQEKINPGSLTSSQFFTIAEGASEITEKWLVNNLAGYNKLLAKEVIFRWINLSPTKSLLSLWEIIAGFHRIYREGSSQFIVYSEGRDRKSWHLSTYPVTHLESAEKYHFETLGEALRFYYSHVISETAIKEKVNNLKALISNHLHKEQKKYQAILEDAKRSSNAESYRIKGDLILAYLGQMEKGMTVVSLPNLFSPDADNPDMMEIALDPKLSALANAQKYYKESVKARKSKEIVRARLDSTQVILSYLEQLLFDLDEVGSLDDLEPIIMEMEQQNFLKKASQRRIAGKEKNKAAPSPANSIRHFKINEEYEIFLGKNNRGNDYLISRVASKDDLWFHAKEMPGSHAIIKYLRPKTEIGMDAIETAAKLAAYYSRGRLSGTVEVNYTKVKYVKKIKGGKPGLVIYDNYKTIRVRPEPIPG